MKPVRNILLVEDNKHDQFFFINALREIPNVEIASPAGAMIHGDIRFQGRSVPAMNADQLRAFRLRDVAMIFQDPRAHINPVRTIQLISQPFNRGFVTSQISGVDLR